MNRRFATKFSFLFVVLALWQVLAGLQLWPNYLFPSPAEVLEVYTAGIADGTLLEATVSSLARLGVGYAISLLVGVPLGLIWGRSRLVQDTVGVLMIGLQALPSITWLPIALLWFGLSEMAVIFVVFMGAVWAIAIATRDGIQSVPANSIRSARTLGANSLFLTIQVLLPASLPSMITGMKLGWSFAWRSLMAGELLYYGVGLGQRLSQGRELNDMSLVVAVMIIIIVFGLIFERGVFQPLERRIREQFNLG